MEAEARSRLSGSEGYLEELRLLVEAGIPPGEVSMGATSLAAEFVGGPDADFGVISGGKRADLVLVEGNPLEDIAAASRIVSVMAAGVTLERAPLSAVRR